MRKAWYTNVGFGFLWIQRVKGLDGTNLDTTVSINPNLISLEAVPEENRIPLSSSSDVDINPQGIEVPTPTIPQKSYAETVYSTRLPESFEPCWRGNFREPKPELPPNYGTITKLLSPTVTTLVEDDKLAEACDAMHRTYTILRDNYILAQKECFTEVGEGSPILIPTPSYVLYTETVYNYDGGFTELCDGIPRATRSVSPTLITHTLDVISTAVPRVTTVYSYNDHIITPYPHAPPSCTVADKACRNLHSKYFAVLSQYDKALMGEEQFLTAVEELPWVYCRYKNNGCPPNRMFSCPNTSYLNRTVDLLLWPQESFKLCSNSSADPPLRTATLSGHTLTWPTQYVIIDQLTDSQNRKESDFGEAPQPTYKSVILPISQLHIWLPDSNKHMTYDLADFGTSTDAAQPTVSVPMVPWSAYSDYKAYSLSILAQALIRPGVERAPVKYEIPKTIYHDVSDWGILAKISREALHAIDPCWEYCEHYLYAIDPPKILSGIESASALPSVVIPSEVVATRENQPPRPIETAVVMQQGDGIQNPTIQDQRSDPSSNPDVSIPLEASRVITGAVYNVASVPGQTTLFATRRTDSPGTMIPGKIPLAIEQFGAALPLQVAVTPNNGQVAFTASAVDSQGRTFVAGGTTFSVGGPIVTVNGITVSAKPGGAIVVEDGSSTFAGSVSDGDVDNNHNGGRGVEKKKSDATNMTPAIVCLAMLISTVAFL